MFGIFKECNAMFSSGTGCKSCVACFSSRRTCELEERHVCSQLVVGSSPGLVGICLGRWLNTCHTGWWVTFTTLMITPIAVMSSDLNDFAFVEA